MEQAEVYKPQEWHIDNLSFVLPARRLQKKRGEVAPAPTCSVGLLSEHKSGLSALSFSYTAVYNIIHGILIF
jgi:hypothetical protein